MTLRRNESQTHSHPNFVPLTEIAVRNGSSITEATPADLPPFYEKYYTESGGSWIASVGHRKQFGLPGEGYIILINPNYTPEEGNDTLVLELGTIREGMQKYWTPNQCEKFTQLMNLSTVHRLEGHRFANTGGIPLLQRRVNAEEQFHIDQDLRYKTFEMLMMFHNLKTRIDDFEQEHGQTGITQETRRRLYLLEVSLLSQTELTAAAFVRSLAYDPLTAYNLLLIQGMALEFITFLEPNYPAPEAEFKQPPFYLYNADTAYAWAYLTACSRDPNQLNIFNQRLELTSFYDELLAIATECIEHPEKVLARFRTTGHRIALESLLIDCVNDIRYLFSKPQVVGALANDEIDDDKIQQIHTLLKEFEGKYY